VTQPPYFASRYIARTPAATPVNRPWECPKCGTVHAWWVASCRCARLPFRYLSPPGGGTKPPR